MKNKLDRLRDLMKIPGVGKVIARDLWDLGYRSVEDLKGQDPELMFVEHNDHRNGVQDICMLYTFRCAVYFADTYGYRQDPVKLNWWYWTDKVKVDSKAKDAQIRKKFKR